VEPRLRVLIAVTLDTNMIIGNQEFDYQPSTYVASVST
jgi:hypothetical protein